ncbi:hypothetical protein OS493_029785 [Desmophyllum pertusum]|uniref:CUB domain-containing protein n=1 Tax=Desmophyllum pertusum TaxID=174260 RepID=A0A9W9YWR7_9CNID|nr:hypothetical protein OS493_029785 [Desmophyllum pertusum]
MFSGQTWPDLALFTNTLTTLECVYSLDALAILATTKWPAGTYGIPRAQSGCPSSSGFTWRTGWRFQDTEDFLPSNKHSSNFHLDATVNKNDLKRSFCMKTDTSSDASKPDWPKGKYCIYKKGSCPKGLKSGYITWDDEDWFNKNSKGGVLPDGVYDKNTKLYYCCRTDGNKAEPMQLPTIKPFFLVAYESAACQQVKWALVSSEWIRFDTEKDGDGYGGAYPYGAGLNDHTIHYCYYTSCNYTLTKSSDSFQSPNYPKSYPAGQYCSWRIKVPEGFAGDMVPPPSGVRSSSNELFVILKTDNKSNFAGFQASYSAQRPTQPPTTVKTTPILRTTKATATFAQTTIKTTTVPSTTGKKTTAKPKTTAAIKEQQLLHRQRKPSLQSKTTQAKTASVSTTGNTKSTESRTEKFTTKKVEETTVSTSNTQTGNSIPSTSEATDRPSKPPVSQTTVYTKEATGSSITPETEATNEPTHTRPTEYGPSTLAPIRNASAFEYRKKEESGSSNVALILIPVLCLLLLAICLLIFILYRKRNQRRQDKQDSEQFVYYESNPKVESADSPLNGSGVKLSCDSMENPLYDAGTVNPLYNSKRQITDFYAKPSTEPVMTLDSSHDLGEYANPIYDFTSSPDERYANNTYTELTEVETCHIKILQHAMKNLLVSSVAKSPGFYQYCFHGRN